MIIGGRKNCGKTHELILISSKKEKPIWVANHERRSHILQMAKEMNVEIRTPLIMNEINLKVHLRYLPDDSFLIDDLEDVLGQQFGINIDVATTREEMRSMWIN